jgi:hypothetical protein
MCRLPQGKGNEKIKRGARGAPLSWTAVFSGLNAYLLDPACMLLLASSSSKDTVLP